MGIPLSEIRDKGLRSRIMESIGRRREKSNPCDLLISQLRHHGFDDFVTEYHFAAEWIGRGPGVRERLKMKGWKDWRIDVFFLRHSFGFEAEGGGFGRPVRCHRCMNYVKRRTAGGRFVVIREGGRHNTGTGHQDDCRKYNVAESLGIRIFRFTTPMIESGEAIKFIKELFEGE